MDNIYHRQSAFVAPLVLLIAAIITVVSTMLIAYVFFHLAHVSRSAACGLRARYAAEAAVDDVANTRLNVLAASSDCRPGSAVKFGSSTCATPGADGTVAMLDNSCSYAAQIVSLTSSSANILATGSCLAAECNGAGTSIIRLNVFIR